MKRSELRNDFLRRRNDASQSAYKKQRNLCVTLLRKAKKQYFSNLEPKLITDNKNTQFTSNPFAKSQKTVFLEFRTKTYNRQQKFLEISATTLL